MRKLLKNISANEWKHVKIVALLAIVCSSIPMVLAMWISASTGMVWSGLTSLAPGDINVYLSYIGQVGDGNLFFKNLFTTETLLPVFNIFWFGVGVVAVGLSLTPLVAFHLVRILLIPILVVVAYILLAYILKDSRERIAGVYMLFLGSGVGALSVPFIHEQIAKGTQHYPTDLWVAEGNVFLSMLHSPHFIASWIGILLVFFFLLLAFEENTHRNGAIAGLVALAVLQFHPFHMFTLYLVPVMYLIALWIEKGEPPTKVAEATALLMMISMPSIFYHFFLTTYDTSAAALKHANLTLTPHLQYVLIGFGVVAVLWLPGYLRLVKQRKMTEKVHFLAAWIITGFALLYLPISFQRRFIEGLQFPLVALSAPILAVWYQKLYGGLLSKRFVTWSVITIASFFLVFSSTLAVLATDIALFRSNEPAIFFIDKTESDMYAWLRRHVQKNETVLAFSTTGYNIAGRSGREVYAGHWVNTIAISEKNREVGAFLAVSTSKDRAAFLEGYGIDVVVVGPTERGVGVLDLDSELFLKKVYHVGEFEVYRVIESML